MTIIFSLVLFWFFWTCLWSFVWVLGSQSQKDRSVITGRSHCDSCRKILRWYELIPIVSFCKQRWKCLWCKIKIPKDLLLIEICMGLIWAILWTSLMLNQESWETHVIMLFFISSLTLLSYIDIRTYTIPDVWSLPMIAITIIILIVQIELHITPLLPSTYLEIIIGACIGMYLYLIQMMIPALWKTLQDNHIKKTIDICLLPCIVPLWIITSLFLGTKNADRIFPSFSTIDDLPTWVWGGDIRLWILIGLMVGTSFVWIVSLGYTLGILYWVIYRLYKHKKLIMLPVAPLLTAGVFVYWLYIVFI